MYFEVEKQYSRENGKVKVIEIVCQRQAAVLLQSFTAGQLFQAQARPTCRKAFLAVDHLQGPRVQRLSRSISRSHSSLREETAVERSGLHSQRLTASSFHVLPSGSWFFRDLQSLR